MRERSLARDMAFVFSSTLVLNACNYIFHFGNSRLLGVAAYGSLAALINALTIASIPANAAQSIVARYAAEMTAVGEHARVRALVERVVLISAIVGVGLAIAVAVFRSALTAWFNLESTSIIMVVGVVAALNMFVPALRGALQGQQRFRGLSLSLAGEGIGKAGLAIGFVGLGMGLRGALIGYGAGIGIGLAAAGLALRRGWPSVRAPLALKTLSVLRTGGAIALINGCVTVLSFSDMLAVKHRLAPELAGLYGAVALVGKIILFVGGFLPIILLPRVTAATAIGASSRRLLLFSLIATAAICGTGVVLLALVPTLVLKTVSGGAYLAAAPHLAPYAGAMTMLACATVVANYRIGKHQFIFVYALLAVTLGEVVALFVAPASIDSMIAVVFVASALALCSTLIGARVWATPAN